MVIVISIYQAICYCNEGWTSREIDPIKCCYKMKSKLTAILLELFASFGVGHFYIGQKINGLIKMSIVLTILGIIIGSLILSCFTDDISKKNTGRFKYMIIFSVIIYCMLQFGDIIMFGTGFYKDGGTMELYG